MPPILMIPGPIEFETPVLDACARRGTSHVSKDFIRAYGETLSMLREVFLAPDGQPFVMAGSGTLAWDQALANLVEKGDSVLSITTGYFGDNYGEAAAVFGANVTYLRCEVGAAPSEADLRRVLAGQQFKLIHVCQVDTSSGVLAPLQMYASVIRELQPDALITVDAVCALAGEELRMAEWDIDLVLTGSQKALGVPAGLAVSVVRPRALAAYEARSTPEATYYLSWKRWLPILRNYEQGKPSYFATPPVNHIFALHAALAILVANGGMEARFEEHRRVAEAFQAGVEALGLSMVPITPDLRAHTLSAVRYPAGVAGPDLLPKVVARGVQLAGGLHKEIKAEYFRVGHMGASSRTWAHVEACIEAIEGAMQEAGCSVQAGAGLAALRAAAGGYTFAAGPTLPGSSDSGAAAPAVAAAPAPAAAAASDCGSCCSALPLIAGVAALVGVGLFVSRRA